MTNHDDFVGRKSLDRLRETGQDFFARFAPGVPKALVGCAVATNIGGSRSGFETSNPAANGKGAAKGNNGEMMGVVNSNISGHIGKEGPRVH